MIIAIDVRSLQEKTIGGVAIYIQNLIQALIKEFPQDKFVLFSNAFKKTPKNLPQKPNVLYAHIPFPSKIFNAALKFLRYPFLDELIKRRTGFNPDIFLLPNLHFAAFKKTPYILVIHDLSFIHERAWFSPKERIWHFLVKIKKLANEATHCIAVSNHTRDDCIEKLGLAENKITTIYPGPPLDKKQEIVNKRKNLLFIGRGKRKNLETVLMVWKKLRDEFPDRTLFVIEKGKNEKGIVFINELSETEKDQLLSNSALLLMPSFYEGFGFPALEAMSHGVPVISSANTSLSEVVRDAGILIDQNRSEALFCAIRSVLRDPELALDLSKRALERAKCFSWQATAFEFMKVLMANSK